LKNTDQSKILLFGKEKACYPAESFFQLESGFQLESTYKPDSGLLKSGKFFGSYLVGWWDPKNKVTLIGHCPGEESRPKVGAFSPKLSKGLLWFMKF
jgi:hypothetical protein